jgi:hypothetical protein
MTPSFNRRFMEASMPTTQHPVESGSFIAPRTDAIAVLTADHRRIVDCFNDFNSARSNIRKQELVKAICRAVRIHAAMEEDIFYPALLKATGDHALCEMELQDHAHARRLLVEIEKSSPLDEVFESRVRILYDLIEAHVAEQEGPCGTFAAAEESDANLDALGTELLGLKELLVGMRDNA